MATLRFERAARQTSVEKPPTAAFGRRIMAVAVLPVIVLLIAFRPDLLEDKDQD